MTPRKSQMHNGFTLIEIIVAMLVFAILSVVSYQAIDRVLDIDQRSKEHFATEVTLQKVWHRLFNDFLHIRARPVLDQRGDEVGAYLTDYENYAVIFTRGGLPPIEQIPGGMQRVAYGLDDGVLSRWVWPVLDQADGSEPIEQPLLSGVDEFTIEHLNVDNYWIPDWPPLTVNQAPLDSVPPMIKITLLLDSEKELIRIIPGLQRGY